MNDQRQETLKEIGSAFARTRPPEPSSEMPAQPTLFDDYSFDKAASWSLDPFTIYRPPRRIVEAYGARFAARLTFNV